MRKSKFTEKQIVGILKDAEGGIPVADLLRKHGISKATFFKWRSNYGGAWVSDVKRLRELETENAKLKRMYADLALENIRHQGCAEPKAVRPSAKREIAALLVREHQLPVQRACRVVRLSRTAYHQPPMPASRRDAAVIAALPGGPLAQRASSGSHVNAVELEVAAGTPGEPSRWRQIGDVPKIGPP